MSEVTISPINELIVPHNPSFYADPYPFYARLQEDVGVNKLRTSKGNYIWLVTRYNDVYRVLKDPTFSLDRKNARGDGYRGFELPPALDRNLLNIDSPDHTRLRSLAHRAFSRYHIQSLELKIQNIVDDLLNQLETKDTVDLVEHLAIPLPLTVIGEVLGVPQHYTCEFYHSTTTILSPDAANPQLARKAGQRLYEIVKELIDIKRTEPADDFLSHALAAGNYDDKFTSDELASMAFLLLFAGYENVAGGIALAILAALCHPEQQRQLSTTPAVAAHVVDEFLRYDGPAQTAIRRFPLHEVTINGVTIPAGAAVLCSLAAANRDPAQFPHPNKLDFTRDTTGYLAFGYGIHYCLAAWLGKPQIAIVLSTLFERFPTITLDIPSSELPWRPSWRNRTPQQLPVRLNNK